METWIEEWHFQGRPPSGPDSDKSPRYHVRIGRQAADPFNADQLVRQTSDPILSPQLSAMGYSPAGLIELFNLDALNRISELDDQMKACRIECEEMEARAIAAEAQLVDTDAALIASNQRNAMLESRLADLDASAKHIEAMEAHISNAEAELAAKDEEIALLRIKLDEQLSEQDSAHAVAAGDVDEGVATAGL